MTPIAVVLGGGGVVGGAFEIGALAAIAEETGWDARQADLLVGTSAGAGVAALLRIGFSPADLLLRAQGRTMSNTGQALAAVLPAERVRVPRHSGFDPLGFLRPTAPFLVFPTFLAPGPIRPGLLAGLLPRGRTSTDFIGDRIRLLHHDRWPQQPTWITALRLRDGKRVVFGRDDVAVPDLGVAVEASSAIPGYFEPVAVGDHEYSDGGMFSPTNADLVAPLGFDLVIVISPMSAVPSALNRSMGSIGRTLPSRTLAREIAAIRARGTKVLVIQPTAADLAVMGRNPLADTKAGPVARQAFESTARHLRSSALTDQVDQLRSALDDGENRVQPK